MHILYCYTVMAICSGKTISITADTYYTRLRYSVLAVTNTVTVYNVYFTILYQYFLTHGVGNNSM